MPEFVYALHDFQPENDDEVSFRAGERIEVLEKDDLYSDGWWQGRNLQGAVGLFPQSYTTSASPAEAFANHTSSSTADASEARTASATGVAASTVLPPLPEESESSTPPTIGHNSTLVSPAPMFPVVLANGAGGSLDQDIAPRQSTSTGRDGEVMKATMTDVQEAIEQLGRGHNGDETRSFSFASVGDERETEGTDTDFDLSDMDSGTAAVNGAEWHRGARTKLAEKARRAVQDAERLEAISNPQDNSERKAPPFPVEMSDESDDDLNKNVTHSSWSERRLPREAEDDASMSTNRKANGVPDADTTAATTQFSEKQAQVAILGKNENDEEPASALLPQSHQSLTFQLPARDEQSHLSENKSSSHAVSPSNIMPSLPDMLPVMPSLAQKWNNLPQRDAVDTARPPSTPAHDMREATNLSEFHPTTHNSMGPSSSVNPVNTVLSIPSASTPPLLAESSGLVPTEEVKQKRQPSEWSVDDVVEWLKSKGFDKEVCAKFIDQDITGDVLLELDVNLLKTEIGITTFGKRVRIANALTDLRHPPSISYSDKLDDVNRSSQVHSHSRSQSQSHSVISFPGAQQPSVQHSESPRGNSGLPFQQPEHMNAQSALAPTENLEIGNRSKDYPTLTERNVGLGIGHDTKMNGETQVEVSLNQPSSTLSQFSSLQKNRPSHLVLSASHGALQQTTRSVSDLPEQIEEERGHLSESELIHPTTGLRQRLFGRSHEPSISTSLRLSKDASSVPSPTQSGKNKDNDFITGIPDAGRNNTLDGAIKPDRLSIFGSTFSGVLGKGRKPAPRYSAYIDDNNHGDKNPLFSLPRMSSTSLRKSSSNKRSTTPLGSPKKLRDSKDAKEIHDASLGGDDQVKEKTNRSPFVSPKETEKDKMATQQSTMENEIAQRVVPRRRLSSLRKHQNGTEPAATPVVMGEVTQGQNIHDQIGEPDHAGWMRKKGERYNLWKMRYFILKGPHMYYLRNDNKTERKIKGYINVVGYKVTVDEHIDSGRYGFRIDHDQDKTHFFSSDDRVEIREWMKAIMKATIGRDYSKPVISSCNIPTIPLVVAQAMNPAPRPPSPGSRDATQKALRGGKPVQLSPRDACIVMGIAVENAEKNKTKPIDTTKPSEVAPVFTPPTTQKLSVPLRPSREMRRIDTRSSAFALDASLVSWANTHLPRPLQLTDGSMSFCSGLILFRLAEAIKGRPSSPPVPDSAFPASATDDKLDGLFRLFDFLLDNGVKMGSVSINDIRLGRPEKIAQLLRALKTWEEECQAVTPSVIGWAS